MKKLTTICVALVLVGAATGSVKPGGIDQSVRNPHGLLWQGKRSERRATFRVPLRGAFSGLFRGQRTKAQGSNHGNSYTAVDGWKCGTATGASGCFVVERALIRARYPRG